MFWKRSGEPESLRSRVNQLEIDVQQLRLESNERALAVLNACEKVLHQLEARERKRAEKNDAQDDVGSTIAVAPYRGDLPSRRRNY